MLALLPRQISIALVMLVGCPAHLSAQATTTVSKDVEGNVIVTFPTERGRLYSLEAAPDGINFAPVPGRWLYGTAQNSGSFVLEPTPDVSTSYLNGPALMAVSSRRAVFFRLFLGETDASTGLTSLTYARYFTEAPEDFDLYQPSFDSDHAFLYQQFAESLRPPGAPYGWGIDLGPVLSGQMALPLPAASLLQARINGGTLPLTLTQGGLSWRIQAQFHPSADETTLEQELRSNPLVPASTPFHTQTEQLLAQLVPQLLGQVANTVPGTPPEIDPPVPGSLAGAKLRIRSHSAHLIHSQIPDDWLYVNGFEQAFTTPSLFNPDGDADGDGMSNLTEYSLGTNPNLADDTALILKSKRESFSLAINFSVTNVSYMRDELFSDEDYSVFGWIYTEDYNGLNQNIVTDPHAYPDLEYIAHHSANISHLGHNWNLPIFGSAFNQSVDIGNESFLYAYTTHSTLSENNELSVIENGSSNAGHWRLLQSPAPSHQNIYTIIEYQYSQDEDLASIPLYSQERNIPILAGNLSSVEFDLNENVPLDLYATNGNYSTKFLGIQVKSKDRAVGGLIPTFSNPSDLFEVEFIGCDAWGAPVSLGRYNLTTNSPTSTYVYPSKFFPDDELPLEVKEDGTVGYIQGKEFDLFPRDGNQDVAFVYGDDGLRFYTVSDGLGEFKIRFYVNNFLAHEHIHELTSNAEFANFISINHGIINGLPPPQLNMGNQEYVLPSPEVPFLTNINWQTIESNLSIKQFSLVPKPAHYGLYYNGSEWLLTNPQLGTSIEFYKKLYFRDFASWTRTVPLQIPSFSWTSISQVLTAAGYNLTTAASPGYFTGSSGEPANSLTFPTFLSHKGLVAKALRYWIDDQVLVAVSTGAGICMGLWDGLYSDVESLFSLPGTILGYMIEPSYACSELCNIYELLTNATLVDIKLMIMRSIDTCWESETNTVYKWFQGPLADQIFDGYTTGYTTGYAVEVIASTFATAGISAAVKGTKVGAVGIKMMTGMKDATRGAVKAGIKFGISSFNKDSKLALFVLKASPKISDNLTRSIGEILRKSRGKFIASGVDVLQETMSLDDGQARRWLRKSLSFVAGSRLECHHLIPWVQRRHPLVQHAMRGGFDINGHNNGIILTELMHQGRQFHPKYSAAVKEALDLLAPELLKLPPKEAAERLMELSEILRRSVEAMRKANIPLTLNSYLFEQKNCA